jgi:hypothetical protein
MVEEEEWSDINFSADLLVDAIGQIEFLKDVNTEGILYAGNILERALYRYERFWLPLCVNLELNGKRSDDFYPPLDVAWVWHCHLLAPVQYRKDQKKICGNIINHTCPSKEERLRKQAKTIDIWENMGITFDYLSENSVGSKKDFKHFASCIRYDLTAAADRQKSFYYQVSLPHFQNYDYLALCLERYKKFLFLKKKNPNAFVVPCYGIDLMWHTHQLNPVAYKKDTKDVLGYLFPHDDSVNDRTPGSKLYVSDLETRSIWSNMFKEDFFFPGGKI